jgi:UDP:flavonoid glycosyltransferase YjiC (YdhE family)
VLQREWRDRLALHPVAATIYMPAPEILIVTSGSLGDLHPFIALGQALRAEGFRVVVATSANHRAAVSHEGLDFFEIPWDIAELSRKFLGEAGAAGMKRRGAGDWFATVVFSDLRLVYDRLFEASESATMIVAHSLAFAAQAVAEKRGLPLAIVTLSPGFPFSAYDPPMRLPFVSRPRTAFARAYNRLIAKAIGILIRTWMKPLRRFRRELGLPPRGGFDLVAGAPPWAFTLTLCSPLLAPPQPDHAKETFVAGHSFFDDSLAVDDARLAALDAFLDAGAPPVVFSLGSFVAHDGRAFYRSAMQAARNLRERAVLLVEAKDVDELSREAAPEMFVAAYARHSRLFPRAKINVHHGGIGTCGQALKAGRPQLVTPFFADQPENAARLARLGVARVLPGGKATATNLACELSVLRDDPRYAARAQELAPIVAQEDGAAAAARRIAERLRRPPRD